MRMNVHMNGWTRALTTLLAAGAGGFLLWLAAQWDMHTTGGYWAAMGVVAGCGLLLGAAQLRGSGGNPPAMFLIGLLPVLVCAGWVLVYDQPQANWFRNHVTSWSSNIGILDVVRDVATWNGVLAFGIGLVFACALEPAVLGRRREVVAEEPAYGTRRPLPMERSVADEPTAAEREEAATSADDTRTIERSETTVR
jgi:hypothetical protein